MRYDGEEKGLKSKRTMFTRGAEGESPHQGGENGASLRTIDIWRNAHAIKLSRRSEWAGRFSVGFAYGVSTEGRSRWSRDLTAGPGKMSEGGSTGPRGTRTSASQAIEEEKQRGN